VASDGWTYFAWEVWLLWLFLKLCSFFVYCAKGISKRSPPRLAHCVRASTVPKSALHPRGELSVDQREARVPVCQPTVGVNLPTSWMPRPPAEGVCGCTRRRVGVLAALSLLLLQLISPVATEGGLAQDPSPPQDAVTLYQQLLSRPGVHQLALPTLCRVAG
jgi:hypothetical protein